MGTHPLSFGHQGGVVVVLRRPEVSELGLSLKEILPLPCSGQE